MIVNLTALFGGIAALLKQIDVLQAWVAEPEAAQEPETKPPAPRGRRRD